MSWRLGRLLCGPLECNSSCYSCLHNALQGGEIDQAVKIFSEGGGGSIHSIVYPSFRRHGHGKKIAIKFIKTTGCPPKNGDVGLRVILGG